METDFIIAIGGILLSLVSFIAGQKNGAKADGEKQGALLVELRNIKEDVQELKRDFKLINAEKIHCELNELREAQSNFKKSVFRLHERIDEHLRTEHNIVIKNLGGEE